MRAPRRLALVFLFLIGCDSALSPGEAPPEATRGLPEWFAPNFIIEPRSATKPVINGREIVFRVNRGDCSTVTDARGPSDCARRTTRSAVTTGSTWNLGEQYLLSFEFWIDPKLRHRAYSNPRAVQTNRRSSRLSIARWYGDRRPDNQLFDLKVDATRGVTFLGRTCIPPSQFGKWHRFDMRVRWSKGNAGFLEVRCHGNLYTGAPIYMRTNFPTNQPLHCFRENNCRPNVPTSPSSFEMQLGIIFDAEVANGRRVFPRIGRDGLTIRMRRVVERELFVIFGMEGAS